MASRRNSWKTLAEKALAEILFAQRFPAWDGDKQLFPVSDSCGSRLVRTSHVHLGLVFILGQRERPEFELPYANLSKEDRPYAKALILRIASPRAGDLWAQSVRDLSELRTSADRRPMSRFRSFCGSLRFAICGEPARISQEGAEPEEVAHDHAFFPDSLHSSGSVAFRPRM